MNKKWNTTAQKILQFFDVENVVANEGVIVGTINANFIQEYAEVKFGRRLTDFELNRFKYAFWFPESFEKLLPVVDQIVETCIDNTNLKWEGFDNDYQKKQGLVS